ncbi:MAG: succinylglutamate desuccinylase/aspartoacylase family protein [Microvirga sp.]
MTGADVLKTHRAALAFTILGIAVSVVAGFIFQGMREPEPIIPGAGVTSQRMLGDIAPSLARGPGDTPVFELTGAEPGATVMILGGTHPQEIAGMLAAVLLVENATVKKGRLIVVPQANRSGFTHTDPMEAYLHTIDIPTPNGPRWFRVGMRITNPADQWPDPDIFVHSPSGEGMVGHEARNLNRVHPGKETGWLTSRVSAALTGLAGQSDLVFDLHEAQPEYPVINMMVVHEKAFETAATAVGLLEARRIPMGLSASPKNLHGLSHREFGDFTKAEALLAESANPAMGRFRGRTTEELVVDGRDVNYEQAAKLGRLFVKFDQNGWPLKLRVARHLAAIQEVINAYNELNPDKTIVVENIPDYKALNDRGIGAFLKPPPAGGS